MRLDRRPTAVTSVAAGLIACAACLLHEPHDARAAWNQMNGPDRPVVFALGASGEQHGSTMILGSNESDAGDIFRSDDGGHTWTNAGVPNGGVNRIFEQDGAIFAGTYFTGLHRSVDGGVTWKLLDTGLTGQEVITDIAGPGSPLLFVSTQGNSKLYQSTDDGDTWATIPSSPSKSWTTLAASGTTILAGALSEGLVRSTDSGATWSAANNGFPAAAMVDAVLFDGGAAYAAGATIGQPSTFGVYRSTDNGAAWTKVSVDLPAQNGASIPALEARGGNLYAGLQGPVNGQGLYRSTNGGVNWTRISDGIPGGLAVLAIAFDGDDILAGTVQGVYRTTDNGASWIDSSHGTAAIRGTGSLLRDGDVLIVGLETNGDAGRGIWRTSDAGENWAGPGGGIPQNGTARALGRAQTDLLAGIYGANRGIYRSPDGGATWTLSSAGIGGGTILNAIHIHAGVILAGAWEATYRSTDDGHTWSTVPEMANANVFVSFGSEIYAGMYGEGVRRSTDSGLNWVDASEGLIGSQRRYINSIAVHQGTIFAGTNGAGVYKRVGSTWVPAGMGTDFVMAMHDAGNSLVAAGALTGIYYTTDGGANWVPFGEGYTGGEVECLETDGVRLFAGSRGHALWSRPLAELPQGASVDGESPVASTRIEGLRPNPVRTSAVLRYALVRSSEVTIDVFDPLGRAVLRADRGTQAAGRHEIALDLSALASGVYFIRLNAGNVQESAAIRVVP